MAMLKFGHAAVVNRVVCPGKWMDNVVPKGRIVVAKNVVAQFDPSKWLLSHCFTPGNLVLLADGTQKPIEQIKIGESVITHKGNIKKVYNILSREISEDVFKVSSASLPDTTGTGEHPFYVIDKKNSWCKIFPSYAYLEKVKCIFGGKKQCRQNHCNTNGAFPSWKKAKDLRIGDKTYTPTLHYTTVSEDLNPNRMRLLGYYVAEGRVDIDQYKKLPHSIRFSFNDNEMGTLCKEVCDLMKIEFGINSHSILKGESNGKGFTVAFSSFKYAPWFLKHAGIGSHNKKLSIDIMTSPHSWQKQFIGAWVNGDGCFDSRGIRIVTASDALCSQIVVILDRLDIHSTYQKIRAIDKYRVVSVRGVKRVIKNFEGWHIAIPNSYKHLLSNYTKWGIIEDANKKSTKGRYRYAASTLSTIDKIEIIPYSGLVYNLSVEDDESYLVNRQAVHNCTIMASVDVDRADPSDPKSNYLIKPEYSIFVNNNGDSWETELLRMASKSFLGADNFTEHVQIPELSKGKVIDMALRSVPFARDVNGNDLTSMYVDILIATNKKHSDLVNKIQSGEYSAVSMGCLIKHSTCTQCGCVAEDESQSCKHIKYFKGNYFYDKNGVKRIIAELCGNVNDPESCKFIDASWVRKPAFEGAVLHKVLPCDFDVSDKIQKAVAMPGFEYTPGMYLKSASQSAKEIVRDLEAAEGDAPAPPTDDFSFPEAPAGADKPLTVDTPPAEGAAPPADSMGDLGAPGGGLGGGLGGTPEAVPEPQIEEPKEDATVNEVKDMVKRQLLNQIRREIMKEQAKEEGGDSGRPTDEETSTNDNLVNKSANFGKVLAFAKNTKNDRLYNGLMILANTQNWEQFKKYGYTRNDVLGILHFIDKSASDIPVGTDAVKTLSRVKLGSTGMVPFFTKMIVEIGRKPSQSESKKLASWAKILSQFE
jgi:intein/homing endonuclease